MPFRVRVFAWLINKKAVLTWENLQARRWRGPRRCALCNENKENMNHSLIQHKSGNIYIHGFLIFTIWMQLGVRKNSGGQPNGVREQVLNENYLILEE